jgi:diketogulonate reductase-like aldo/keto reductase
MRTVSPHGVDVPALGFGTARFDDDAACRRAVEHALDVGYRHVDTAQMYGTERAVGAALQASDVDRSEVFLTTKLDTGNRDREAVLESTRASLTALDTDYLDLLLIHSPSAAVPHAETLRAMHALQEAGLVRHVGVSNFSVDQLADAIAASESPILTNQVEYNPHTDQSELLAACLDADVLLTAYSPLDVGAVADNDTLIAIGDAHGKSPAQVALRWLLQQPLVAAIPKATSDHHVEENAEVFDFELSDREMERIFAGVGGVPAALARETAY